MRGFLIGLVAAVALIGLSLPEVMTVLANCTGESCDNIGKTSVACPDAPSTIQVCADQGSLACPGTTETLVLNGLWACGSQSGKCNCRDQSISPNPKCYEQWTCRYDGDTQKCEIDPDTHSVHRKVPKTDDTCQ